MSEVKAAALVWTILAAGTAAADVAPEDASSATRLFTEGRRLLEAGEVDVACTRFAESLALDPQIGTRLNLADCRERQGRLVEAYTLFDQVADEGTRTGKTGRLTYAKDHLAALAKRLGSVRLQVTDQPGLAVTVAGKLVPRASWASVQVVAPGTFVVDALSPGHEPLHLEKTAGAGETITVEIPLLAARTGPDVPPPPPDKGPAVVVTPPPRPAKSRTPVLVMASGATLFAASVVVALHARSRWQTATDARDSAGVDSALHEADVATGLGAAGLVAGGIGVFLYLRAPHGTHIVPTADAHAAGVSLAGHF